MGVTHRSASRPALEAAGHLEDQAEWRLVSQFPWTQNKISQNSVASALNDGAELGPETEIRPDGRDLGEESFFELLLVE